MRNPVDRVVSAFEVNLVPILVTIAASFVLFAPSQFREIYRGLAQRLTESAQAVSLQSTDSLVEFGSASVIFVYTVLSLTLLSVLLWLACRSNIGEVDDPASKVVLVPRKIISLGLAFLPFLFLALGSYAASVDKGVIKQLIDQLAQAREFNLEQVQSPVKVDPSVAHQAAVTWATDFMRFNDILIGLSVVFALLGVLLVVVLNRLEYSTRARSLGGLVMSTPFVLGAAAIFVILSVVYAGESGEAAAHVSAVPIFLTFAALALIVGNYLTAYAGAIGRLIIWLLVVAAIIFSLFEISNNHRVRLVADATKPEPKRTDLPLRDAFDAWYASRTDRSKFPGRYPIYVVAAQGGGAYAAMHAATFLSYMQQRCPNFAHHLFAISGVSGGSIGASVFAASMREAERRGAIRIPDQGCDQSGGGEGPALLDVATEVLGNDFWSPLEAMSLFPDLLQRFLPVRVQKFDRALALERRLEAAWQRMITNSALFGERTRAPASNVMADPFVSLWPEGFGKSLFTPALVLNTTEVESGRRRLIAPFKFDGLTDLQFLPLRCVSRGLGGQKVEAIPLSTAAVLSARFPWVTPPAWFYETPDMGDCTPPLPSGNEKDKSDASQVSKVKVTDGGYFESSGVASALDLTDALRKIIGERPVDITLIILTSGALPSGPMESLNEVLDPIRTMLNASEARGYIEVGRAVQASGKPAGQSPPLNSDGRMMVMKVELKEFGYPLPLGWSLSNVTGYLIRYQTGEFGPCEDQLAREATKVLLHSSKCIIGDIAKQLTYP